MIYRGLVVEGFLKEEGRVQCRELLGYVTQLVGVVGIDNGVDSS